MINYNKLNPFKRLIYGIRARTNPFYDKFRFIRMRNSKTLIDPINSTFDKDSSYRIKWFDFQHEKCLAEWDVVTDQLFGGQSTADLFFDKQKKQVQFEGYVETRDKDRMAFYPFINFMRSHPIFVKLGPFRLIQVEVKTDGIPLQVHLTLNSLMKGQVNIYGFILSKETDWQTYEIPIENMILRGTEQDYHQETNMASRSGYYYSKRNQSSIFVKNEDTVKKILQTEILDQDSISLSNIGFRLVSTQNKQRSLRIRNINFAYKKGYQKFVADYKNPYFYKTSDEIDKQKETKHSKKLSIDFLKNSLENVNTIDTGDIFYQRKTKKSRN